MSVTNTVEIMRHHEEVSAIIVIALAAYLLFKHQTRPQTPVAGAKPDATKAAFASVMFLAACAGALCFARRMSGVPRPVYDLAINRL